MRITDWAETVSETDILVFSSEEFTFTLDFGTGSVWGSASPVAGSERLFVGLKDFGGCSLTLNERFGHTNNILEDIGQGILSFISTEHKTSCDSVEYKS